MVLVHFQRRAPLWSAVTCHRFGPGRPVAAFLRSAGPRVSTNLVFHLQRLRQVAADQSADRSAHSKEGPGHGSVSRAFYARAPFVAGILGDGYHLPLPVAKK